MKGEFFKHWPTMLLGLLVAVVLLVAVFSFQLNQNEIAVVTTLGRPDVVADAGLHFRWPYPFQKVYFFDKRIRCYEGSSGKLEETSTRDGHNILAGIYVNYRISDADAFFRQLQDISNAEDMLNTRMRSEKNAAFGQYEFSQIVNSNPAKLKLGEIQKRIENSLREQLRGFGIEVVSVGINSLGVPKTITEKVFDRMIAERKKFTDQYLAEGRSEAKKIRVEADSRRTRELALAQAKAQKIRAEGDAAAVEFYKVFSEEPRLAQFLRKIEALRQIMRGKTTIVLDTDTAPFDLLRPDAALLRDSDDGQTAGRGE